MTLATSIPTTYAILADLWLNYRADEDFKDFVEYNDLGLPLAYALDADIVKDTPLAQALIKETWDLFLEALDAQDPEDGFESLEEILGLT